MERALKIDAEPRDGFIFSRRMVQKADGDYDGALAVAPNRRLRSIREIEWR